MTLAAGLLLGVGLLLVASPFLWPRASSSRPRRPLLDGMRTRLAQAGLGRIAVGVPLALSVLAGVVAGAVVLAVAPVPVLALGAAALGAAVETGAVMAVIKTAGGSEVTPTAPHKGIVTAVHAAEGDSVNEMTFLFTITDVDPLWGVLDIPERSLAQVKPGQKAEIKTAAYPREVFKGSIAFVSPEIDNVSRTIKARVAIENPAGRLKFGMFLDAAVHTGGYLRGVTLRSDAVQNGPAGPFVFVKTGGEDFAPRPVETGGEKDGLTEIIKGVSPGDKVVVEGAFLLKSEMMKSQMGEDSH